jgi:glycosyltransferase involved in cell wall biosynthesis
MSQLSDVESLQATASPDVSVVTFKDAGDFLTEAIDSVRAQTFPGWELLLVDDGSTDTSTAIAKRYADEDGRVGYLEHPGHANRGVTLRKSQRVRSVQPHLHRIAHFTGNVVGCKRGC